MSDGAVANPRERSALSRGLHDFDSNRKRTSIDRAKSEVIVRIAVHAADRS